MDTSFFKKVEASFIKRDIDIRAGDTISVSLRIVEAGKERSQIFEGVVLNIRGSGLGQMVTVRKISHGVGVERIFPVNSPLIKKIDVIERGNVRRAKLFYLRKKVGRRSLDVNQVADFEAIVEEDKNEELEDKNEGLEKQAEEVPETEKEAEVKAVAAEVKRVDTAAAEGQEKSEQADENFRQAGINEKKADENFEQASSNEKKAEQNEKQADANAKKAVANAKKSDANAKEAEENEKKA